MKLLRRLLGIPGSGYYPNIDRRNRVNALKIALLTEVIKANSNNPHHWDECQNANEKILELIAEIQ